jgi:tetratricopeptide (TPR) repeat protein
VGRWPWGRFRNLAVTSATVLGVSLAVGTWGDLSLAETQQATIWQKVKAPDTETRQRLMNLADRKREPRDETYDAQAIRTQLHRASATLLGLARVDTLGDVDLLYLYGECLAFAGVEYAAQARGVLQQALTVAPGHPNASGAWDSLGRVNMALGDYAAGYRAFERSLASEWQRDVRDAVLIEQGLGALRAGELIVAIERLRAANGDSQSPVAWALSQWALAVAMDRALWGPEAERLALVAAQAKFGASGKQDVLSLSEVVLEPESEVLYYRALAAMGRARVTSRREQRSAYQEAKFLWLRYLDDVGPTGPWSSRVERHLAYIDRLEARIAPSDGDLHSEALRAANFDVTDAGVSPLWPEELEQGAAFWGLDAGKSQ